jgi:hypothetical protein
MENIFITLYMEYQENVLKMMKQKKIITLMKQIIHINHVMKDVLLVQDMVLSQIWTVNLALVDIFSMKKLKNA